MAVNQRHPKDFPTANSVDKTDLIILVKNANTTANLYNISAQTFFGSVNTDLILTSNAKLVIGKYSTPANSSANCIKGEIWFDSNYIYLAVANNDIRRVSIESFS